MNWKRTLSSAWLTLFIIAACIAHVRQASIEAHRLSELLQFGRDAFGRKCVLLVFSAAFETFRIVLPVGVVCLAVSFGVSLILSTLDRRTEFTQRLAFDTLSSLPGFLISLALSTFYQNNLVTLFVASFFMTCPWLIRFFESQMISLREREFVTASRAMGAAPTFIFSRHFLPEFLRMLTALTPYLTTRLVLIEISLSFLGIGKVSNHESWGGLLYQGRDYLTEAPWILAIAGFPLCITLFSLHLLTRADRI